jgi:hypothetical protein
MYLSLKGYLKMGLARGTKRKVFPGSLLADRDPAFHRSCNRIGTKLHFRV